MSNTDSVDSINYQIAIASKLIVAWIYQIEVLATMLTFNNRFMCIYQSDASDEVV